MKGILVFKNVADARSEGFEVYEDLHTYYIVVRKVTSNARAFAIALREPCLC
jgi:hypothetical protein